MPETKKDQEPAAPPSALAGGVKQIFETQKWVITAFSAVAAALIAGSQLSEIGDLRSWSWRFDVAVAGITAGIIGVSAIIWKAVEVLSSNGANLGSLAADERRYYRRLGLAPPGTADVVPPIGGWQLRRKVVRLWAKRCPPHHVELIVANNYLFEGQAKSFSHLQARIDQQFSKRQEALGHPTLSPVERQQQVARRTTNIRNLKKHQDRLLREAIYATVLGRFRQSRSWLFSYGLLAGLGIAAFAWASHPPAAKPSTPSNAVTSRVALTPAGKSLVASFVGGEHCVADKMSAVVEGAQGQSTVLVILPPPGCTPARFVFTDAMGTISK